MPANKRKTTKKLPQKKSPFVRFWMFITLFAVVGAAFYVISRAAAPYVDDPQHRSECVQNAPGLTSSSGLYYARPGQSFNASIAIRNTGSSTFAPSYGAHLLELNNESFTNYWSPNRFSLGGNVGPGGTASFSITTTAPSTPGTYPFGWAIGLGANGAIPYGCSGVSIKVTNPPVASLTVNGQSGDITLTKGAALGLNWSSTNGAQGCNASGSWSGAKAAASSENRSGDTASSGTKTYSISCYNQVGTSSTIQRRVTVVDPPATPPPSTPKPAPSTPTTNNPTPRPSTARTNNQLAPAAAPTPDTTPPTDPSAFSASFEESLVSLTWNESQDNVRVKAYAIERSTDGSTWEAITGDGITDLSFKDSNVSFNATYQYRIRAIDDAGNSSGMVNTSVQTGSFEPNLFADKELELKSDDGMVTVKIPAGAVTQNVQCSLQTTTRFAPSEKGYQNITGPYEILCKQADSQRITSFAVAPEVSLTLSKKQQGTYSNIRFFVGGDEWRSVETKPGENRFTLNDATEFAVMGAAKVTPSWVKLLIALLVILLIMGGGIVGLRFISNRRSRRLIEQQVQDYYNKEHGYR